MSTFSQASFLTTTTQGTDWRGTTAATVACCLCGTSMVSNPTNMCIECLKTQVDVSEGVPKTGTQIFFCRGCDRYNNGGVNWSSPEWESPELLALCLKRIPGLNKVKMMDASFVWTEPHSKRIKIKLTLQKEVHLNMMLQQQCAVELIIQNLQCTSCQRTHAKDFWNAVVQVRQKVGHKRTLLYLEQLIIQQGVHDKANVQNLRSYSDGFDFYHAHRKDAEKLVEFLQSVMPVRVKSSTRLTGHDSSTNAAQLKHTYSVEIVAVCKGDVCWLPPKLSAALGGVGPLVMVSKVSSTISLVDPRTAKEVNCRPAQYFQNPFKSSERESFDPKSHAAAVQSEDGTEVVAPASESESEPAAAPTPPPAAKPSVSHIQAEVTVAPNNDLSASITVLSHLGHFLHPGDTATGYDMYAQSWAPDWDDPDSFESVGSALPGYKASNALPELVLVGKHTEAKVGKAGRRRKKKAEGRQPPWRLKRLDAEAGERLRLDDEDSEAGGDDGPAFIEGMKKGKGGKGGKGGKAGKGPLQSGSGGRAYNASSKSKDNDQQAKEMEDMEDFMKELEDDEEMRANVAVEHLDEDGELDEEGEEEEDADEDDEGEEHGVAADEK